ncbi:helix-turn-helix domain-containing protein, partial [Dehalococcoidia bacterium]|nr:helix-turn-helix domain-containing protein [Dehalococcoidia bacterium]
KKGLTLRDLSKMVKLNFTYLSKIENEKVEYTPSADKIRAIAKALGADEIELLKLANKVPPELEHLTDNINALQFLRRTKELTSPEDWKDLLEFIDKKYSARKKTKKEVK